jgi:hydrogenase 3 maturation protease
MKTIVKTQLQRWLSGAKKVTVLCIGSAIRTDDAFGPALADRLRKTVPKHVTVIDAGTVPENYTGTIRRLAPSHVLIVDTADMGLAPGEPRFVEAQDIEGFAVSTHAPPLKAIAKYLSTTARSKVALFAVQPGSLEFGEGLTEDLRKALKVAAETLIELLRK